MCYLNVLFLVEFKFLRNVLRDISSIFQLIIYLLKLLDVLQKFFKYFFMCLNYSQQLLKKHIPKESFSYCMKNRKLKLIQLKIQKSLLSQLKVSHNTNRGSCKEEGPICKRQKRREINFKFLIF